MLKKHANCLAECYLTNFSCSKNLQWDVPLNRMKTTCRLFLFPYMFNFILLIMICTYPSVSIDSLQVNMVLLKHLFSAKN